MRFQAQLDHQIDPLGLATMDLLAVQPGEAVLDIGCGCGQTSVQLAERAGASGRVVGVDISQPMLEVARARPSANGIAFQAADAQTADLGKQVFDAVYSRFGVMFFDDPAAAFSNIRSAMKPGARLAMLCWRGVAENPLMRAPFEAVAHLLPPPAPPSDPFAPGPFAFANESHTRSILEAAGFSAIRLDALDMLTGGASLQEAIDLGVYIGPVGAALREDPTPREAVLALLSGVYEAYLVDGMVRIPTATWIVTARA